MRKTLYDFKIFFAGKIYQINKNLKKEIQTDLDQYPELKFSVRSFEIDGFKVRLSINRSEPHAYYADEDYIRWNDAVTFSGNFKNDDADIPLLSKKKRESPEAIIPMPDETFSSLHDYCFVVNMFVKDYNTIVGIANWVTGFRTETTDKYFTLEYIF